MFAPETLQAEEHAGEDARSFNEAGACLPRKRRTSGRRTGGDAASMRPGHVCPGNGAVRGARPRASPASMRPGHVCPGNIDLQRATGTRIRRLQ